jgi:hypothetical protein
MPPQVLLRFLTLSDEEVGDLGKDAILAGGMGASSDQIEVEDDFGDDKYDEEDAEDEPMVCSWGR